MTLLGHASIATILQLLGRWLVLLDIVWLPFAVGSGCPMMSIDFLVPLVG